MFYTGVEGQFILGLSLNYAGSDVTDTIKTLSLNSFSLVEETGNLLPTFQIAFEANTELKPYWNENLILQISIGMTRDSPDVESELLVLSNSTRNNGMFTVYMASGTYNAPAFAQTTFLTINPGNGTDIIKKVASKYFSVDTEYMTSSVDPKQNWKQQNTTDKKYLDYIVQHSYIDTSSVGVAITSEGSYRIVDIKKTAEGSPKYEVGHDKDIKPVAIPGSVSKSGYNNAVGGYGADLPIVSTEFNVRNVCRSNVAINMSSGKVGKASTIDHNTLAPVEFSANVHEKFYNAYANYVHAQSLISMEAIDITFLEGKPVKVWDLVNVLKFTGESTEVMDMNVSGKYLVSIVSRSIKDNTYLTTMRLTRPSSN